MQKGLFKHIPGGDEISDRTRNRTRNGGSYSEIYRVTDQIFVEHIG